MPPSRVEGGTIVFDVDDISVQLPGKIKYGPMCRLWAALLYKTQTCSKWSSLNLYISLVDLLSLLLFYGVITAYFTYCTDMQAYIGYCSLQFMNCAKMYKLRNALRSV